MKLIQLLDHSDDGRKVALVGWQVANVSKLPERGHYEVVCVGNARTVAFLDVSRKQLADLLIEDGLPDRVDRDINVFWNAPEKPPRLRPVAGVAKWHSDFDLVSISVERMGDHEDAYAGGGMIQARATFDPPLSGTYRVFASVQDVGGMTPMQNGRRRSTRFSGPNTYPDRELTSTEIRGIHHLAKGFAVSMIARAYKTSEESIRRCLEEPIDRKYFVDDEPARWNKKRNSDEELRRLERDAKAGDEDAARKLAVMRRRTGTEPAMPPPHLIRELEQAIERDHHCDSQSCDVHAALETGAPLWAAVLVQGSVETPNTDEVMTELHNALGETRLRELVEADRELLLAQPHIQCSGCGAVNWEVDGWMSDACDNCGHTLPSGEEDLWEDSEIDPPEPEEDAP